MSVRKTDSATSLSYVTELIFQELGLCNQYSKSFQFEELRLILTIFYLKQTKQVSVTK